MKYQFIISVGTAVTTELEGLRADCRSIWRMKLLVLLWNYFHQLKVKVPGMVVSHMHCHRAVN